MLSSRCDVWPVTHESRGNTVHPLCGVHGEKASHPANCRLRAKKLTLRDFPSKSVRGVGDREENATGTQVERLRNALAIGVQEGTRERERKRQKDRRGERERERRREKEGW